MNRPLGARDKHLERRANLGLSFAAPEPDCRCLERAVRAELGQREVICLAHATDEELDAYRRQRASKVLVALGLAVAAAFLAWIGSTW
ncbi:hypothetical protein ACFFKU_06980 [Kineococcus gynurae]|uniref:Uncharacterized protein n=1 Tax=Kineococcus gynurae TaxID=452979 RepID=A0ABV5LWU9_9ACTN